MIFTLLNSTTSPTCRGGKEPTPAPGTTVEATIVIPVAVVVAIVVAAAVVEVEGGMDLGLAGDVAGEGIGEGMELVVDWKQVSWKRPDESERVMFR